MDVLTRVEVAERMTSEEFFRYAPEDQKAELIDGVMIVHCSKPTSEPVYGSCGSLSPTGQQAPSSTNCKGSAPSPSCPTVMAPCTPPPCLASG